MPFKSGEREFVVVPSGFGLLGAQLGSAFVAGRRLLPRSPSSGTSFRQAAR